MTYLKIYKTKVQNASKTLDKKVDVAAIYDKIRSQAAKLTFSQFLGHKELNFWDFGVQAGSKITAGDSIKIVCGGNCYDCLVIHKIYDASGEIGDLFGWARVHHGPWRNVFALTVLSFTTLNEVQLKELLESSTLLASSFYSLGDSFRKAEALIEGSISELSLSVYERNPIARKACLDHFGLVCQVCGFDFEQIYGELGSGFIHVHHLTPLSQVRQAYVVDPVKDLIPVCPNCHAMLHIRRGDSLSIEELRNHMGRAVGLTG